MSAAHDRCGPESRSAVAYFASDDAGYVTGTVLPLDGGFHASGAHQW